MSQRAIKTLSEVDVIACEDTRHTIKICNFFNIKSKLYSYYREKEQEGADFLLGKLISGKNVALVSDAGTPALCDPGSILVQKARSLGIKVEAVAGPSALTAALSISGLTLTQFYFGGFLPAAPNERKKKLESLVSYSFPLIFFESPHRIKTTLNDMLIIFGDRYAQLFRELTKLHEECIEGKLSFIAKNLNNKNRGELVLLIHGQKIHVPELNEDLDNLLIWYRDEIQSSLKNAVQKISFDLDLPRTQVYKKALLIWKH